MTTGRRERETIIDVIKRAERADFWFWEKETLKELCSLRSSIVMDFEQKICIWSMLYPLVVLCSFLVTRVQISDCTLCLKIFRSLYILGMLCGCALIPLSTTRSYIREKAMRGVLTTSVSDGLKKYSNLTGPKKKKKKKKKSGNKEI